MTHHILLYVLWIVFEVLMKYLACSSSVYSTAAGRFAPLSKSETLKQLSKYSYSCRTGLLNETIIQTGYETELLGQDL